MSLYRVLLSIVVGTIVMFQPLWATEAQIFSQQIVDLGLVENLIYEHAGHTAIAADKTLIAFDVDDTILQQDDNGVITLCHPEIPEVIKRLQQQGYSIIVLSARPVEPRALQATYQQLFSCGIKPNHLDVVHSIQTFEFRLAPKIFASPGRRTSMAIPWAMFWQGILHVGLTNKGEALIALLAHIERNGKEPYENIIFIDNDEDQVKKFTRRFHMQRRSRQKPLPRNTLIFHYCAV